MKSIELTEEHKSKLLEMCKILFPEYRLDFHETQVDVNACFEYISLFKDNKDYDQNNAFSFPCIGEFYHWFEFCMIHLISKLSEEFYIWEEIPPYVSNVYPGCNKGKWNIYTKFHFHFPKDIHKIHPIDYLYEEFKKLTK